MKTLIIIAALTLTSLFASAQSQHRTIPTVKVGCVVKKNQVIFNKVQLDSMLKYNALSYTVAEVRTYNGVSHVILQKKMR